MHAPARISAIAFALLALGHVALSLRATVGATTDAARALAGGHSPVFNPGAERDDQRRFLDWVAAQGEGSLLLVSPGRQKGREVLRYFRASVQLAPRQVWWSAPMPRESMDWHEPLPRTLPEWRALLQEHDARGIVLDGCAPSVVPGADATRVRWFDESRLLGILESPP